MARTIAETLHGIIGSKARGGGTSRIRTRQASQNNSKKTQRPSTSKSSNLSSNDLECIAKKVATHLQNLFQQASRTQMSVTVIVYAIFLQIVRYKLFSPLRKRGNNGSANT